MPTKIDIVAGDYGYILTFTLTHADGTAYDLTGLSCTLKAQNQNETTLAFTGSMSVTDAAAGECQYTVAEGDFADTGTYLAEIEVSSVDVLLETFSDIIITAKSQLPRL